MHLALDRKTANKELNRILRREKEQTLDSKQKTRLAQKIHAARVNLNYTIYYPLTEKYISLYPKSKEPPAGEATKPTVAPKEERKEEKPPVWQVIERCMEDGTLDRLREGKLNVGADGKPTMKSKNKTEVKESRPAPTKEKPSKSSGHREKQIRKDYGRERDRLQDIPAEPVMDDSDGGFFEE